MMTANIEKSITAVEMFELIYQAVKNEVIPPVAFYNRHNHLIINIECCIDLFQGGLFHLQLNEDKKTLGASIGCMSYWEEELSDKKYQEIKDKWIELAQIRYNHDVDLFHKYIKGEISNERY